jgi:PAS domain S-box-containing protein
VEHWGRLLLIVNITGAVLFWVGRNDWSHRYIRAASRRVSRLNPWWRTNQLLTSLLQEVQTSNGRPLREALEHLAEGLDTVQGTLAMIHVRQRMYDRVLENATCTTDEKGRLTWASDGFLRLAGCSLDELRGDGWINAIHQDDRALVMAEWRAAITDGRDFVLAYRYRAIPGRGEIHAESHAYAARAMHNRPPVGWVAIVREVPAAAAAVVPVEPRVNAVNLRLDREMGCYHPPMGEGMEQPET